MLRTDTTFRPATHDDAQFAAATASAVEPDHPQVAAELLDRWINTEKSSKVRRFVIQEGGIDRGWISLVQPGDVGGLATYLNLMVPPVHKHLLPDAHAFGEAQAREMGASVLICSAYEDNEPALERLRADGWKQERRERFWRLDLAAKAERIRNLRTEAQKKLRNSEVAIHTVADLGGEPFLRRLLPVAHEAVADIPMSVEYIPEPYEDWVVWLQPPAVLPERIWVGVVDGEPVGYSYLAYRQSVVETGFTGVLREHRGKGFARALKLETLVQAIDLGVRSVDTDNDSENAPILHINEELGYSELPGKLEFHRKLTE
jgi:GNAT superfamily N-acetyltransferase